MKMKKSKKKYKISWTQKGFDGVVVGKRIYDTLEEAQARCDLRNAKWEPKGIHEWPIEWIDKRGSGEEDEDD